MMGICLDTEQSNGSQSFEESTRRDTWAQGMENQRYARTPPDGRFPMHNGGKVLFEKPRVPVIFVLGGPGSGKVTHCDNLTQEQKGMVHINMTDLLQQYAIGNDMQDFAQLSSRTVTEVLMLEMKMSPNAKTFLVSGYPRNMRDVVEYSEKIQQVNGAILISWRQRVLERQIDYGAKLGQVVLSLARMELSNFFKNVMPVAEYFDQSEMLISINGERHPGDVFEDFRAAVMRVLGRQDDPPVFSSVVPPPPATATIVTTEVHNAPFINNNETMTLSRPQVLPSEITAWPPIIWVIGGPGSNKAVLCSKAAKLSPGWAHLSVGRLLRDMQDSQVVKDCITNGELVPQQIVMGALEGQMAAVSTAEGILIDGFPRDAKQARQFEARFEQQPNVVLLDCSKLQLGRGRLDDSVSAFRRRLEIFREATLPMLKTMDNASRLNIVDGDTDTPQVQEDFNNVILQHMDRLKLSRAQLINGKILKERLKQQQQQQPNHQYQNGFVPLDAPEVSVQDLEPSGPIQTISKRVTEGMANGHVANGMANGHGPVRAPALGNGFPSRQNYGGVYEAPNHM